ncbi:MAG: amidohydrolase [Halodesulfurarchaeum sp.]
MAKSGVFEAIDQRDDDLRALSKDIWEHPEIGLEEEYAANRLREELESAGFTCERGIGGMPTAFTATYGEGEPVIGILGEYDALPDLSQTVSTSREAVEVGDAGHGCGHNLFGVAGIGAAMALAEAIDRGEVEGTVRFYGTPAEETIVGKVFMARAGAFDDLDAALTWHPADVTGPQRTSSLAVDSIKYTFTGTPAHAAMAPGAGRSALDAVQLMNTGVEYLREHAPDKARIHYTITDGGGAPNVVPAEATVWYFIRSPTRPQVENLTNRVDNIAEGAALMTETEAKRKYVTGAWELLTNDTIADLMWENMQDLGPVPYDEDDREFAAELHETIETETLLTRLDDMPPAAREALEGESLYAEPLERTDAGEIMMGSTDVSDVSWIAPTAQFRASAWPVGARAHTWQATAASGGFGRRSVPYAAKVLAGTAYDLMSSPERLEAATEEFESATGRRSYETPLPSDAEPPFGAGMQY